MVTRLAYTLLLYLLLPYVLARLAWRARRQPGYLGTSPSASGITRQTPAAPLIWVHAVSVGETRAAEPLMRALLREVSATPHAAHAHDADRARDGRGAVRRARRALLPAVRLSRARWRDFSIISGRRSAS